MVHFLSSEPENRLEKLRKELECNTADIVKLFRDRVSIAEEIGKLKEEHSIPIRIRDREQELLLSMGISDRISRSIISSLFEFTIVNESEEENHPGLPDGKELVLEGTVEQLELLAGFLISSPGMEVYSSSPLPGPLKTGLQSRGAHIISGDVPDPDLVIGIGGLEGCGISIGINGILRIRSDCLFTKRPSRILVKRA